MKTVLYIGNRLQNRHTNVSSIQTLGALLESENYTMHYASSKVNKVARLLDMVGTLLKYRNEADFVLIDTYSTLNFYYAFIISQLCRLFKVKYLPNLNGGNLPMRLKKNPVMSKMIFKNAHLNISPSMYLKTSFEGYGFNNVRYVPNTITIENYDYLEREFEQVNLLWVRSFSEIYNPKLAVRVLKKLLDNQIEASLCMVGPNSDGSLSRIRKYASELGVEVKFTGKLEKQDWIRLSRDYNMFINTTNFDNTPVSVIEAMALGLPVVSTNVGGIPFLIADKEDGLLVEPNDADQMCAAIMHVIQNPSQANQITRRARHKVEQFDWQIVKSSWLEILN